MQQIFTKFINLKSCSHEEYIQARNYYVCDASVGEKKYFDDAIRKILNEVTNFLADLGSMHISEASHIYGKYGLAYHDFKMYFNKTIGLKSLAIIIENNLPRRLYLRAKKQLFSNEIINILAKEEKITSFKCRTLIFNYASNNHPIDSHSFFKFRAFYVAFYSFSIDTLSSFSFAYQYYHYYAAPDEKQIFESKVFLVMNKLTEIAHSCDDALVSFLETQGLSIFDLGFMLDKFGNMNLELATYVSNYYKKYYEMAKSVDFKREDMISLANSENISYKIFFRSITLYAKYVLKDDNFKHRLAFYNNFENKTDGLFREILAENNQGRVIELFLANPSITNYIRDFCYAKNKFLPPEEQRNLERNLLAKKQIYLDYLKNNRRTKPKNKLDVNTANKVGLITKQIIDGDISFVEAQNILGLEFGDLIFNIKRYLEHYPEELAAFNEVLDAYKNVLAQIYNLLAIYIKNGIATQNGTRNFDFLDYFMLFNNINMKSKIYRHLNLSREHSNYIQNFFKNFVTAKYNLDVLLKSNFTFMIDGEYRTLTREEIEMVVAFLESNGIPLYVVVVDTALLRYAHNELDITPLQQARN